MTLEGNKKDLVGIEEAPRTFQKRLIKAGSLSLIGAAVCLIIQLPLLADSRPGIQEIHYFGRVKAMQAIPAFLPNYEIFISVVIAAHLFCILAFGAWYIILREKSRVGALGALLLGIIALAVDLAADLPISSSKLVLNGTAYRLVLDVSSDTSLMSTFIFGVAFLFLGYSMHKSMHLFGNLITYLASLTGVLFVALVPMPFPTHPTEFLVLYMWAIIVQIVFLVLSARKMYRALAMSAPSHQLVRYPH